MTLTSQPVTRKTHDGQGNGIPRLVSGLPAPARPYALKAWQRRWPLLGFVVGIAVATALVALLLPPWFEAQSKILPPGESSDTMGIMGALIENTTLSRLGLFTSTTPSDMYVEILRSRTLRENLIRDFDLQSRYRTGNLDATLKELDSHVKVSANPVGVVTIRVEDRDRKQAADMANHLVDDLDRFNRESVNTRARRTREFLEKRVTETRVLLTQAESTLTAYEKRNKIVASNEATAVGAMASVISEKMSLEVKRSYMSSYSRPGSAPLRQVETEIAAMDRELARLPSLKQEGSRLALDAEIQRRVFTLLTAQYEDMRIQEMRDTPTLTVLDRARPPDIRARPRRSIMVLAATAAASLLAAAWVIVQARGSSGA